LAAACSGPRTGRAQGVVQEGVLERRWLLVQPIRFGMLTTASTEDHLSSVRLPLTSRVWREFRAANLTRSYRDILLTLNIYRESGGIDRPDPWGACREGALLDQWSSPISTGH
jgi:hypothetical protein